MASAAFAGFIAWHRAQLALNPFKVNAVQSGTLMCVGDSVAQALERRSDCGAPRAPSASRTLILSSWAAGVNAPFWVWYYRFLHARFPGRIALWVFASAGLSPFWNAAFFTYATTATHIVDEGSAALSPAGRTRLGEKVRAKLETQLLPTVQRSMCLWIPFNFLNFSMVPLEYRMLTGSSVALLWNVYLSLCNARPPLVVAPLVALAAPLEAPPPPPPSGA